MREVTVLLEVAEQLFPGVIMTREIAMVQAPDLPWQVY
jgi:hypothetical protein